MGLFTDEEAVSALTPGCRRGDSHVENEDKMAEVSVWIWIERDDAVDTMVATQVAQRSARQHSMQVATSTIAGRRRQLWVSQVDVPAIALDALHLGALALRRESVALAVDAEHVLVRGRRPAHLSRVGPP